MHCTGHTWAWQGVLAWAVSLLEGGVMGLLVPVDGQASGREAACGPRRSPGGEPGGARVRSRQRQHERAGGDAQPDAAGGGAQQAGGGGRSDARGQPRGDQAAAGARPLRPCPVRPHLRQVSPGVQQLLLGWLHACTLAPTPPVPLRHAGRTGSCTHCGIRPPAGTATCASCGAGWLAGGRETHSLCRPLRRPRRGTACRSVLPMKGGVVCPRL